MHKEEFMRLAIQDAKKHKLHFGAVVVKGDKVISIAGKRPRGDPRYHAETQALIKATNRLKTRDLTGCTLYSTCEPCPMCFYMAWITNVSEIVYGSTLKDSIDFGFKELHLPAKEMNKRGKNKIKLSGGFLREECLSLFKK
ncbi:MAG: nucleoside deaminase [Nanoarchaeota archaeon]